MTDTQYLDWGAAVDCIMGANADARSRARALWNACSEVIDHPGAYMPLECAPKPPILKSLTLSEVESHVMRASENEGHSRNVVRSFATWRAHVTEVEAHNAARLFMLASTLRTLADLLASSTQPAVVSARIGELGSFIERAWGIAIPLGPGDVRRWSRRMTRREDLLSVEERNL